MSPSVTFLDLLSVDLSVLIVMRLYESWPLATRTLRVSKAFAALAQKALSSLPSGEWWTGSLPPLAIAMHQAEVDLSLLRGPDAAAALRALGGGDVLDLRASLLQVRAAAIRPRSLHYSHRGAVVRLARARLFRMAFGSTTSASPWCSLLSCPRWYLACTAHPSPWGVACARVCSALA